MDEDKLARVLAPFFALLGETEQARAHWETTARATKSYGDDNYYTGSMDAYAAVITCLKNAIDEATRNGMPEVH